MLNVLEQHEHVKVVFDLFLCYLFPMALLPVTTKDVFPGVRLWAIGALKPPFVRQHVSLKILFLTYLLLHLVQENPFGLEMSMFCFLRI